MFRQGALLEAMGGLKRFSLQLTGNKSDADDLLQSTMLKAIEKKHLFQPETCLAGWTSKIMLNLFISDYRRKTKFESKQDPENILNKLSVDPPQDKTLELYEVQRAIDALSDTHKEILIEIGVKGLYYAEASEKFGIPVGTVRSRLSRARRALHQGLSRGPLTAHSASHVHREQSPSAACY